MRRIQLFTPLVLATLVAPVVAAGNERLRLTIEGAAKHDGRPPVITAVAVSADGQRLVASGDDSQLAIWDASTGETLGAVEAHHGWVRSLCFLHDGGLASASADRCVKLWDITPREPTLRRRIEIGACVNSLAIHPQKALLTCAGFDGRVHNHDLSDPEATEVAYNCSGRDTRAVAYSPDGRWLAAAGRDGVIRLWNTVISGGPRDLPSDGRRIRALAFSPDGATLAAAGDGPAVRLWRLDQDTISPTPDELLIRPGKAHALAFTDETTLAVGGTSDDIMLWNTDLASIVGVLRGHTGAVATLAASDDGSTLVSGSFDTTVRVWEIDQARLAAVVDQKSAARR